MIDKEFVKRAAPGDLVVSADIALAAEVIAKGADAVNPRGELLMMFPAEIFSQYNILAIFVRSTVGKSQSFHEGV